MLPVNNAGKRSERAGLGTVVMHRIVKPIDEFLSPAKAPLADNVLVLLLDGQSSCR